MVYVHIITTYRLPPYFRAVRFVALISLCECSPAATFDLLKTPSRLPPQLQIYTLGQL
jgi:hypothetical protein